uniref:Cathepsin O n=1 Tax=Pyxicephalus adspersus TaxID=30357 RepID=A0AAV3APH7_PYXAD|nr:TPA: hypothetical protein GDO54_009308 [Pyxicephalus adspersus]
MLCLCVLWSGLCIHLSTSLAARLQGHPLGDNHTSLPEPSAAPHPSAANDTFLGFLEIFGRKYPAPGRDVEDRYRVFLENLERHKYLNGFVRGAGDAFYGINQFSDLSAEEFSHIYLKSYPAMKENYIVPNETFLQEDALPLRFDWRDKNFVTTVKNQMDCGACWAFSIVDTVESAYAIKGHPLTELSVQQVIDCSYMDNGCNGGSTASALRWLLQSQTKLVRSSVYPYKSHTGSCHYFPSTEFGVSIKGYKAYDLSGSEAVMMKLLIHYGPLAVIVDALSWQYYLGGIIQHHCSSGHSNHAVLVVGYDKSGDIPYWIVKNSWGTTWGIDGYVHIKMGDNLCALWHKMHFFVRKHSAPCAEERRIYNRDFAVSTSFHGLHNLVHGNSTGTAGQIRRVLWFIVVMVSVIAALSQVCSRIINYFSWPTTTSVTVKYVDKIEFPSVTFCNLNRFQTRAVHNLSVAFFMWNIVSTVLHFSNTGKDSEDIKEMIEFLQLNQNFSIKDFTKNNGFYLNNSTLLKCDFFGNPCYPQDFEHVFTEYGNCYTFNHNTPESNKRISTAGKGLSVLFDIKQTEFTDDPALGFVDAGITFVIHSPKVPPRFDGLGLHSPVGMHAHASIRHFKSIMQEYPWGQCNPDLTLKYHEVYSTYGCVQECKAHYIQEECGCLPFLLPGVGKECDLPKFYNCVYPALYRIDKLELCSVGTYNSSCPVPCEETDYPATLSYSTFPSDKAADFLSNKLSKNISYIRCLTASLVALLLGLFCGASMITVIEILEFVLTNFFWACAFLLLKVPNISQWTNRQLRYKQEIQD